MLICFSYVEGVTYYVDGTGIPLPGGSADIPSCRTILERLLRHICKPTYAVPPDSRSRRVGAVEKMRVYTRVPFPSLFGWGDPKLTGLVQTWPYKILAFRPFLLSPLLPPFQPCTPFYLIQLEALVLSFLLRPSSEKRDLFFRLFIP